LLPALEVSYRRDSAHTLHDPGRSRSLILIQVENLYAYATSYKRIILIK